MLGEKNFPTLMAKVVGILIWTMYLVYNFETYALTVYVLYINLALLLCQNKVSQTLALLVGFGFHLIIRGEG